MKKLHTVFKFTHIKKQINMIFLLSSIIPVCLFGLFAIVNARRQMLWQYEKQVQTEALRINSTLFDLTTSIRTMTMSICNSEDCRNLFSSDTFVSQQASYEHLNSQLKQFHASNAAISSIRFYTDNPSIEDSQNITVLPDGFEGEDWFQATKGNSSYNIWTYTKDDSGSSPSTDTVCYTLVERIFHEGFKYNAFLVTKLDNNYMRNRLLTNDSIVMASIDDSPIVFCSNRNLVEKEMPQAKAFENKHYNHTGLLQIEDRRLLTSTVSFIPYQSDNFFYILVGDVHAYRNINQITLTYFVILMFVTLVPTMIILAFSTYFSRRIHILEKAMHQASVGDYNIIDTFSGDDELAGTFQDLKKTVTLIHEKEARYYRAQITEQQLINNQQQMEFKMLASQINPHFLYNTLETIRMQALSAGNREVSDSIHLLGKTMHYVLENTGTDSTTIAKELEHILTYLQIQKLRFHDRVNYSISVPPYLDLTQFHILPLLLQPIVENAIVHGLEGVLEKGMIDIQFILEEPNLYITISDNGDGMDEETLTELRKHIAQPHVGSADSIGLRNINQRIKLLYGEEYGLTIQSNKNKGTTLTLSFPLEQIIESSALENLFSKREQYWSHQFEDET